MISFDRIKEEVPIRQAAERYGIHVDPYGYACCPFHHEDTPSLKVDTRYHCFGCQADGDVIDFTAGLFGLSLKDAAEKLASDFGVDAPLGDSADAAPTQKSEQRLLKERFNACWRLYCEYLLLLKLWQKNYAPKSPDDEWDNRFTEAQQYIDRVEYYLDELWVADWPDRKKIMDDLQADMDRITDKDEFCFFNVR